MATFQELRRKQLEREQRNKDLQHLVHFLPFGSFPEANHKDIKLIGSLKEVTGGDLSEVISRLGEEFFDPRERGTENFLLRHYIIYPGSIACCISISASTPNRFHPGRFNCGASFIIKPIELEGRVMHNLDALGFNLHEYQGDNIFQQSAHRQNRFLVTDGNEKGYYLFANVPLYQNQTPEEMVNERGIMRLGLNQFGMNFGSQNPCRSVEEELQEVRRELSVPQHYFIEARAINDKDTNCTSLYRVEDTRFIFSNEFAAYLRGVLMHIHDVSKALIKDIEKPVAIGDDDVSPFEVGFVSNTPWEEIMAYEREFKTYISNGNQGTN